MTNKQVINELPRDTWNIEWYSTDDSTKAPVKGERYTGLFCYWKVDIPAVIQFSNIGNNLTCEVFEATRQPYWGGFYHKKIIGKDPLYTSFTTIKDEREIARWIILQLTNISNDATYLTKISLKTTSYFVSNSSTWLFKRIVRNIIEEPSKYSTKFVDEAKAIVSYKDWECITPGRDGYRYYKKAPTLLRALVHYVDNEESFQEKTIIYINESYEKEV